MQFFNKKFFTNFNDLFYVAFLIGILFFSIIGIQFSRFFNNYIISAIVIFVIAIIPLIAVFGKMPKKFFPLAIFVSSISLLYCTSLGTGYLWGADNYQEYYYANLAKNNGFWDSTIPNSYNAMLSITMLAPILSIVSGIPIIWLFKIIYPLLFSFVPLILYLIFKSQIGSKASFFSTFFFISLFTFYTEMIGLARQQIAEIFLCLIIFLIIGNSKILLNTNKTILLIFFSIGLVLSHYSVTYIFIFSLLFVLTASYIWKNKIYIRFQYVAFIITASIGWYIFTSNSTTLNRVSSLIVNLVQNLFSELFSSSSVQPIHILISSKFLPFHEITRLLNILMVGLIAIGFIAVVLKKVGKNLNREFVFFAGGNFALCLFSAVAPYLASSLNTTRLYQTTLIILSPFFIFGLYFLSKMFIRILNFRFTQFHFSKKTSLKIAAFILPIFLLFNTGFMYSISNEGSSIINPTWAINQGTSKDRAVLYNSYVPIDEIASAIWIKQNNVNASALFSDYRARNNAINAFATFSRGETQLLFQNLEKINGSSYIYLRQLNIVDKLFEGGREETGETILYNTTAVDNVLSIGSSLIYCSGGSQVYYLPNSILLNSTIIYDTK